MHNGYLCLVLHAHLPFVRHPEEKYFLEENWLYEAITETYIPLIIIFDRLIRDGVDFRITMSLTPTLVSMLQDPLLQDRYIRHIDKLTELATREIERNSYQPHFHNLALMYYKNLIEAKKIFVEKYQKNLILAFKKFQEQGYIEIIGSCATHGFLPLLNINPLDVKTQIYVGVENYIKTFGQPPKGFWLPECGYYPGVDDLLKDTGVRYFFVDSHGLVNADPAPRYSVYAPIYCPSGTAAFGRDWESSKQVWSSKEGYPGDTDYREYYKDIGYELEYEYIKPYIHPGGIRINTGFKYWRITGNADCKEPYVPDRAQEKAAIHAGNFMFNREKQIEYLASTMDRKPIVVAPYDAELFGHWWFEGPMWIDFLSRKIHYDQKTIRMITPSEYLKEYPVNQLSLPSASSWGYKGYNEYWVEESNDWVYPHLHKAGERMLEIIKGFSKDVKGKRLTITKRAVNQAVRELLLAQASDWPFIMKTGTMVPYAHRRIRLHLNRFTRIYNDLLNNSIDKKWLKEVEGRDNIFSEIDCARFYLPGGEVKGLSGGKEKRERKKKKRITQ
ncbi:MAG: 1,4-alpha-glucan branching protein domain-containing protein [bacterium]